MTFKDAKVLVTGGAGFIGSHLVDALLEAAVAEVVVVDNFFLGKERNLATARTHGERFVLYKKDAADIAFMSEIIDRHRPDVVFNLATKALLHSFEDPFDAYWVNVHLATTLAEMLRQDRFEKLVHVSSSEVYGSAVTVPMKEDHPLGALTTYAAGKASADLLMRSYVAMFDLDVSIIRPFNTYGPRQNESALAAVIPATIRRISEGEAPLIEGSGEQTRDFLFVADTVRAIMELGSRSDLQGRVVNVGSGSELSVKDLIATICDVMGYDGPVQHAPERIADVERHFADVSAATSLIGGLSRTTLRAGIEQTVDWYRQDQQRVATS